MQFLCLKLKYVRKFNESRSNYLGIDEFPVLGLSPHLQHVYVSFLHGWWRATVVIDSVETCCSREHSKV